MTKATWRRNLTIRLNSDLCVASGDGFSSSVDVDVCHDQSGIPVIPARRIKGCLRECACMLGYEGTDAFDGLFGVRGSSAGGSLRVFDASLLNAHEMIRAHLSESDARDQQAVLSLFTYIRAQTALDSDGSAKENTLRFIRVVKQFGPNYASSVHELKGNPLVFTTEVSCDDSADQTELLTACCKALRNIGYGRNRGLGAITCKLVECDAPEAMVFDEAKFDQRDTARISYAIRLDSALMLPQNSGSESIEYVPGTSVLGFFASKLKDSHQFDDLFLRGKVKYSPLYPVRDGFRCRPSSPYIVKIKGGDRDGMTCTAWQVHEGETVKPLKDGFVDCHLRPVEVATEMTYHHSVNVPNDEKMLYTQKCLQPNQYFAGYIESEPHLLDELLGVIKSSGPGGLSFGRSKTAQYSRCTAVGIMVSGHHEAIDVISGARYAFVLDSDALLLNGGAYSTTYSVLAEAIKSALGEHAAIFKHSDFEKNETIIGTGLRRKTITGYNSKWNMKKPHVQALSAGSCIVFEAVASAKNIPSEFSIGERLAEGFGRVLLVPISDDGAACAPFDPAPGRTKSSVDEVASENSEGASIEELRCVTEDFANTRKPLFTSEALGRAFIGRLARMVEESNGRGELEDRVASIKSKQRRMLAKDLINGLMKELVSVPDWSYEQECLSLLFALGKYYSKQAEAMSAGQHDGGVAR